MASKIAAIEDALTGEIITLFAGVLKTVEWAPPDWDDDFIRRCMLKLPGVFLIFGGGPRSNVSEGATMIDTQWSIVAVTRFANTVKPRARGEGTQIGCYDILEAIAARLDGYVVADVGTMELLEWNNEASLKLDSQGLMMQSLAFHMPITLDTSIDLSALDDFKLFHDNFDIGQKTGAPTLTDNVDLPQ